jgi:hypothetical protein
LETAIPGSSEEIVHLLSGMDSGDKTKKVKEYSREKNKKSSHSSMMDDLIFQ